MSARDARDGDGPGAPVAVFVHVHYLDVWEEVRAALERRLALPFRLFVTSSLPEGSVALPVTPDLVSARVLPVENRGRDVLPFLRALGAAGDFDVGLKLHTKRSPQREDGALWRGELLDSLLPPRAGGGRGARGIVERLRADPRVGLVAPTGFALSVRPWVLQNRPGMARVMGALGHELVDTDLEDAQFAAGSMFWFRRAALARLAGGPVLDLFEEERGQLDGTIAHAMERLFPVEARCRGLRSLAVSALLASDPRLSDDALRALAARHADRPSTYFPAPYVPALPPAPRGGRAVMRARARRAARWVAGRALGLARRLARALLPRAVRAALVRRLRPLLAPRAR